MIKFEVLGEPKRKGRPRFAVRKGFVQAYTDKETVEYENLVKLSFVDSGCKPYVNGETLSVDVKFYFPIPTSVSKKKRNKMLSGEERHTKKPDVDNCLKAILDALNNVAYNDDSKIVDISGHKYYGETARSEIVIDEVFTGNE